MILSVAQVVAGLGLFFAGMELLSGNLRSLTSRRFQRAVAAWTATPWQGFLWGVLAGATTQNTSVVTFIVVGLLVARTIDVARGLPIILGCNVGISSLLFVVSLDVGPAVLLLLGLVGIAVTLDRLQHWRTVLWALFGATLLFVGLDFVKTGAVPLAESGLLRDALEATAGSCLLAFLAGAALTVAAQSSVAIAVLAMSLALAGLLHFETAIVVTFGTNFGSGLKTLLLSGKLRGEARQLASFQVLFKAVGCLIFLPLFFVEQATHWPLLLSLLHWISPWPAQDVAWVYLIFNSVTSLLLLPLLGPAAVLLARLWPRTAAEDAARPAFIGDFALEDPDLALDLAAREQHRIFQAAAALLDPLVDGGQQHGGQQHGGQQAGGAPAQSAAAPRQLLRATAGFLEDLGGRPLTARQYGRLYGQLDDQDHLGGLLTDVGRFTGTLRELAADERGRPLGRLLADSLHAALHSCADALAPEADSESVETAVALSGERGPVLRSVRDAYLGDSVGTARPELATAMLAAFSQFERILWQVHAMVARRAQAMAEGGEAAEEAFLAAE